MADRLFRRPWRFLCGASHMRFLPMEGPLEIAFAGRSNVGKSSLINSILNQKSLARTSNQPGRTQELNFFIEDKSADNGQKQADDAAKQRLDQETILRIVDMPGYGFAKAPKSKIKEWTDLILHYVKGRASLKRVYLLIDARHGIKASDKPLMDLLDQFAVSYQIILTKSDKLAANDLNAVYKQTMEKISKRPAAFPFILVTSSAKQQGITEVRDAIIELIKQY